MTDRLGTGMLVCCEVSLGRMTSHQKASMLSRRHSAPLLALAAGLALGTFCLPTLPALAQTTIGCDQTVTGSIDTPAEIDVVQLAFDVAEGEVVSINVGKVAPAGPAFNPIWRLLTATNAPAVHCGGLTSGLQDCGPLPAAGSPYQIEIRDSGANDTGTYQVHVQRDTAAGACETTPLPCDTIVTGTIDTPIESDLFPLGFTVAEGEVIAINIEGVAPEGVNFNPVWRLFTAAGLPAADCGGFNGGLQDCGPLPAAGNPYRVEVRDSASDDVGTYRLHAQRLTAAGSCGPMPIACDEAVTGTIDDPIESDLIRFAFNVAEGETVSINVDGIAPKGTGFNPIWRLLTAAGLAAPHCGGFTSGLQDCGPLPAAGSPYQIEIRDSGANDTGTYQVHVQRDTAAGACETTPLPCDTIVTGTIDTPIESDLFPLGFTVAEGEVIAINIEGAAPEGDNFNPVWRLFTAAGLPAADCGGFNGGLQDCGPLPAAGNPYRVEVRDSASDDVGTYRLHAQRLTAAGSCGPMPIACDEAVTGTIDDPIESDLIRFAFNVAEGETVSINVDGIAPKGTGFNPIWRLLTAAGLAAPHCGGFTSGLQDCGPLPAAGSPYQIEIRDSGANDTGTYQVHVQRDTAAGACETTPLPCDTIVTGTIDTPIESDLFPLGFTVAEGEVIAINIEGAAPEGDNFNPVWRLFTAAGLPAADCGGFNGGLQDCGPLPAAGNPYRVEVRDSASDDVGTYRLHAQRLTAAGSCGPMPIACDEAVTGTIDDPIESDLIRFAFNVAEGETVSINVDGIAPKGTGFNPIWRLLTAAGLAAPHCGGFTSGLQDCGPLPAAGSPYQIEIRDSGANDTGTYQVHLQRDTAAGACETTPLPCDTIVTGTIDTPIESDLFPLGFTVAEGEVIAINIEGVAPEGVNFNPVWRLFTAAGLPAADCGGFNGGLQDCGPLPAAGNPYRVEVRDSASDDVGTYRLHAQRLTAAGSCGPMPIACDEAVTGTIDDPIESDLIRFAFNVAEGETVSINVDGIAPKGTGFNPIWRLLTAAGLAAPHCGGFTSGLQDCGPLPAAGSPYQIEIRDSGANDTGTYQVHLQRDTAAGACETTPLPCDTIVTGTIDTPIESDLFPLGFTVAEGEVIAINIEGVAPEGVNFNPVWRLFTAAGLPAADCGGFNGGLQDCGPLPAAGNP